MLLLTTWLKSLWEWIVQISWFHAQILLLTASLLQFCYICFCRPAKRFTMWILLVFLFFNRSLIANNPLGILAVMQPNLGRFVFHIEPICSSGLVLWTCFNTAMFHSVLDLYFNNLLNHVVHWDCLMMRTGTTGQMSYFLPSQIKPIYDIW